MARGNRQVEVGALWERREGVLSGDLSTALEMLLKLRAGRWELVAFPVKDGGDRSPSHRVYLQERKPKEGADGS